MDTINIFNRKGNAIKMNISAFARSKHGKVQVGKDQEKAQSEKRLPLQKPRWEKTKLTIRYLYHETYRKPNEQLFSQ